MQLKEQLKRSRRRMKKKVMKTLYSWRGQKSCGLKAIVHGSLEQLRVTNNSGDTAGGWDTNRYQDLSTIHAPWIVNDCRKGDRMEGK
jgi:hypothetical protein